MILTFWAILNYVSISESKSELVLDFYVKKPFCVVFGDICGLDAICCICSMEALRAHRPLAPSAWRCGCGSSATMLLTVCLVPLWPVTPSSTTPPPPRHTVVLCLASPTRPRLLHASIALCSPRLSRFWLIPGQLQSSG